jgi:hypothetical protein
MRSFLVLGSLILVPAILIVGTVRFDPPKGWTPQGADARSEMQGKKTVFDIKPKAGVGYLWLDGVEFREGTIEVDLKGTGSFGVAFGMPEAPEAIVFVPDHFKQGDASAVTYWPEGASEPAKSKATGHFEAVRNPNDWFTVRIDVKPKEIRVFLGDSTESCLSVDRSPKAVRGKAGICVRQGGEASFSNFKVTPFDDMPPKDTPEKKSKG